MRGAAFAAALCAAALGCAHLFGERAVPECPGALVPSARLGPPMALRERVHYEGGGVVQKLEIALESRDGTLHLVGMNPLGMELFRAVQRGVEVEVEALPPGGLAVDPMTVLRDLHRVHFLRAGSPPSSGEGDVLALWEGTRIRESWSGGALRERRFDRLDGEPPGTVTVTPGREPGDAAVLRNGWCGYEARFLELHRETLP